jgi:glycine cleavage system regulatory protein
MNSAIVLTIIADDKPGIVEAVSKTLKSHNGNWTKSSMSSLAGQFAGILLASVPEEEAEACLAALKALEADGLRIIIRVVSDEVPADRASKFFIQLVGNDRPGIVHDITSILADHKVSVSSLETSVEGASMGGGELFKASAELRVPEGSDILALERNIEALANDLMVDIKLVK